MSRIKAWQRCPRCGCNEAILSDDISGDDGCGFMPAFVYGVIGSALTLIFLRFMGWW